MFVISCRVTGGTCRELPPWKQDVTKALTKSSQIPLGNWAFLVENYQNIINEMTVRAFVSVKE
jgi:hypothetical protein